MISDAFKKIDTPYLRIMLISFLVAVFMTLMTIKNGTFNQVFAYIFANTLIIYSLPATLQKLVSARAGRIALVIMITLVFTAEIMF